MQFTPEERTAALARLPKPLADFIESKELSSTYGELYVKYGMNLRQANILIQITDATLLSLSPQTAFPQVVVHALPELPPESRDGLLKDIEEQIFKKARKALESVE